MKNFILFALFSLLAFTGCKKEAETPKDTNTLLQGTWRRISDKYEYYDTANAKIFEKTTPVNSVLAVSGQDMTQSVNGTISTFGTYALNQVNDRKYLIINQGALYQTYELVTLTNNNMTWQLETPNDYYYDGSSPKTAAKSILTIEFQR